MNILQAGLLLNSALYLVAVFIAALLDGNLIAEFGAITTMGVCYLGYAAQLMFPALRALHVVFVVASIALGVGSGLALLVR